MTKTGKDKRKNKNIMWNRERRRGKTRNIMWNRERRRGNTRTLCGIGKGGEETQEHYIYVE